MSISDRLDKIEQAARVIGSVMSRWDMDGRPDVDGGIDTLLARALAEAGLLAPSTLREEWGVQDVYGETPVARRAYDGSFIRGRDTAQKYGTGFRRPMRRYVTDWEEA